MVPELIRVRLLPAPEATAEEVLSALSEALGRPAEPLRRLRAARVLILELTAEELALARELPCVARAEREGRCELPPRPRPRHEIK